ncbi:hypothetical protein Dda_3868 [Drechslerella dactyloides]|uniref:Bud22 domain-containing protein n=1 Tax=Drechslerella dactyloides TaxID=74499 RepID=A0AAD6IYS0_DREDA|nr:hypothetical protein Dda_3868 [Drechslerella dactyloides]
MPKRKRSDYEAAHRAAATATAEIESQVADDLAESARAVALQQQTVEHKIHHHRTVLKRALKTAKGFEQQKLGKRIKAARKGTSRPSAKGKAKDGGNELQRLEQELEALKDIDLPALAATYLTKTLLKNRQISSAKYFPPSLVREAEEHARRPPPTGPVANVCARLLNANPVRDAVKEIVQSLERLLNVDGDIEIGDIPAKEAYETKEEGDQVLSKALVHGKDSGDAGLESQPEAASESESEDMEILDNDDEVVHPSMLKNLAARYLSRKKVGSSASEDEGEEPELRGRIAWSSDENDENDEDDEDDGSHDDPEPYLRGRSMSITPIPEDKLRELEIAEKSAYDELDISSSDSSDMSGDDDDDNDDDDDDEASPPPRKTPTAAIVTGPIKSSSFLPTLNTGYFSGSDSEASSSSTTRTKKAKKGPPEKKLRKNRMGQQARRALAEKKFGTSANHIKKEREEKEAKARLKEQRRQAWEEQQAKPAHISWELKRRDKEAKERIVRDMMAGKTAGAGVGKKIVFD